MKRHHCTCCCIWALASAVAVAAGLAAALTTSELAAQLYPGYTVLQLAPSSTSSLAAAIAQARGAAATPPSSFLVIFSSSSKPLVVDEALAVGPGEAWALSTAAGLQAAADGAALAPADLLPVRCSALRNGSFITNSESFSSLDLLGMSINGCPSTALDLSGGKRLLLSNTHLKGSNAKDLAEDGGAALLREIDEVTFVNSACVGNSVLYNGGCVNGARLGKFTALNSSFTNNWKSAEEAGGRLKGGGVLFFESLGAVTITSCDFAHNSALYGNGGSLFCSTCGDLLVTRSRFTNNSAGASGGCIYAGEAASVTMLDCNFTANGQLPGAKDAAWTENGGAIATDGTRTSNLYPVNLVVRRSTFVNNKAVVGGAIMASQYSRSKGRVEVHDCRFSGNTGKFDGGAVMIEENQYTELVLNASSFENNQGDFGGAVSAYDADVAATNCSFIGNKAGVDGGALHLSTMQAAGSGNQLALAGCTLSDNTAGVFGGAVAVYNQGLAVKDSSFEANQGGSAGAIYLSNGPNATLLDSVFERNTAEKGSGGAIRLASVGQLDMQGITMNGNEALGGNGGAMQAAQVSDAMLSDLTVTDGYADVAGGGLSFLGCSNVTLQGCTLYNNTAPLGAGMAADSSQLVLQSVNISSNLAVEEEAGEGGRRRKLQQAAAADGLNVRQYGSEVYASTTGGAILVQQSSLSMADSSLAGNTAGGDAGALFVHAPSGLNITNVTFAENVAERGVGGGVVVRGAGAAVAAGVRGCTFSGNAARLGSGGAVVLDSGLGPLQVAAQGCSFTRNTAGRSGGAIAAAGPTALTCTDCSSQSNQAGQHGGWLHCSGCSSTAVTAGRSSSNTAGAAGGAAMYGVGAATAGLGCGAQGAGGGLCMSGAAAATIQANSLTGNKGSTGGALFASADCEAVAGGCRVGQVNVTDLTARDNSATEAGGVLYTTTPAAVNVGDAGKDPASTAAEQRRQQIVQQLSESNTVGEGGYGPAVASFPTTLSLMHTAQDEEVVAAPQPQATAQAAQQQQQQSQQQPKQGSTGRRLQQLPLPPGSDIAAAVSSATADIKQQVNSTYRTTSAPTAATSDTLQPFCPALGASITAQHAMAVGANQNFSLPVSVLDAFGSQARRGPGSDWIVALSQNSGGARTLSGNMRGALSGGYVVLQGLSIQAEPGSRLNLTLSAVPPPGSGDKPLSATIDVLVRPCLAGEYATVSSEPGQASSSVSCRTCAAPTFSFSAYLPTGAAAAAASEKDICQSCPERGICVAGMVIPESGAFQVHPRSTVIRRCPNVRACQRNATATLNLQGLQCANRRYIDPADIDPQPYTALQCSAGYAGPFCSSCYRPGRNLWLLQQLERAGSPQQGFTLGDQVVLASGRAGGTAGRGEVYGKASGRCRRCPHLAAAWLGFLLSRLLDLLVIGCMAALWLLYGWLSHSAAATAFVQLKHQRMASLKMRDSIFGSALSIKGGLQAAPTLSEAYFSAASSNASAARSATLSREMQREMRHQPSSMRVRESAARQASGPPVEHAHLQLQASVTQPLGTGPGAIMELPNGSRVMPPAGAAVGPAYTSPFSLVDQPSVQHMLVSEPSGSSLQGAASRVFSGGLYHIYRPASMRWSSAVSVVDLLRQQYMHGHGSSPANMSQQGGGDDVLGQQAALLLMAVKHLACLAQVLLDAAQVAAVLLSLDLVLLVPDWAAQGLAGVLLTQAHTWQYVPFECLIPGGSQASAAVAQTVAVMLLPVIYTLVLSPLLLWLVDLSRDSALFRQHVLARAAAPAASKDTPAQASTAAAASAGARPGCGWLSRFWPVKSGTWTLFAAVAVASMAYCYSFYVATLTAAFNCMSLSTRQGVLGEQQVTRSVWVPDMQLSCSSPQQLAAMAVAILIGIPLLVGYWLLLLTLAWPKHPASPAPVAACKASSRLLRALASYCALLKRACLLPFTWLERPVRTCQRLSSALGVSGESCAALSVWNVEWRWWWLAGREAAKFGLVAAAALTTMRGPDEQARVLLLLVVIAAALSWRVQAGCSTSMNQLQFLAWCWLQLLALLVVMPSMQDISAAGFGAALLALVALVMLQCGVVIGCLVWRIVASLKNLSLLMALEAEGGGVLSLASVAELS
ncbi:hypothetical protein OEZ85_008661 [Tetradesmus obliquus]|uniref:Right handed beta helix domain-containing protein n=1 Tax=Tetradesmus obliquus TaxID=3088 RepID=A0ABY8TJG3_TETOB|nr:hypothetical protein OEZ85_008661 [Tetradesmus obliquus]